MISITNEKASLGGIYTSEAVKMVRNYQQEKKGTINEDISAGTFIETYIGEGDKVRTP